MELLDALRTLPLPLPPQKLRSIRSFRVQPKPQLMIVNSVQRWEQPTPMMKKKKKKRRTERVLLASIELMANKIMERQEQIHKQLMEFIEKDERERIHQEEAWQRREMEWIKRDEDLRAQGMSTNLALISLIRKILVPEPEERQGAEIRIQQHVGGARNRWPAHEVQALVSLRTFLEHGVLASGSKGSVWEEISIGMSNMGYERTAAKCKEKWNNMNKYARMTRGKGKKQMGNDHAILAATQDLIR